MSARQHSLTPSRASAAPMAFTGADLWRGSWSAWGAFMIIMLAAVLVMQLSLGDVYLIGYALLLATLFGGGISFVAMIVLTPVAWLLGRALARVSSLALHVLAFTAFGASVGVTTLAIYTATARVEFSAVISSPLSWVVIVASAIAVVAGWGRAVHISRRRASSRAQRASWIGSSIAPVSPD